MRATISFVFLPVVSPAPSTAPSTTRQCLIHFWCVKAQMEKWHSIPVDGSDNSLNCADAHPSLFIQTERAGSGFDPGRILSLLKRQSFYKDPWSLQKRHNRKFPLFVPFIIVFNCSPFCQLTKSSLASNKEIVIFFGIGVEGKWRLIGDDKMTLVIYCLYIFEWVTKYLQALVSSPRNCGSWMQ